MTRVKVMADDGWVLLDEHACAGQMESDYYRRCLGDRIQWAVEDADMGAAPGSAGSGPPEPRFGRRRRDPAPATG
jgi:hypothetical protein